MPIVIDLCSSPELPRPTAIRVSSKAKEDIQVVARAAPPAKAFTYEAPNKPHHEWFDISSDDGVNLPTPIPITKPSSNTSAKPKSTLGATTKTSQSTGTSRFSNDFFYQSDDFDSTVNLDDPFASDQPPAKKPRLSPPPNVVRSPGYKRSTSNMEISARAGPSKACAPNMVGYKRSFSNIESSTKFTEPRLSASGVQKSKTIATILESDPIVFTSSPDPFADARHWKEKRKEESLREESKDDDIFDLLPSRKAKGTEVSAGGSVLISGHRNTCVDFTSDTSSDIDLPDLGSLPLMSNTKTVTKASGKSKGKSSMTVLEEYHARKVVEEMKREKEQKAKDKLAEKESEKEKRRQAKEEKESEKDKRRLAREEKVREKNRAAELAKVNTLRTNKKVSVQEMIVDLPSCLEPKLVDHVRTFLGPLQAEHSEWETILPVIKWRRKVDAEYDEEKGHWEQVTKHVKREPHVLCVMKAKEFVELATGDVDANLEAHVLQLKNKFASSEIIYLIEGLSSWMKKNKNVANRRFDQQVRAQMPEEPSASQKRRKKKEPEYIDEDLVEDALLKLQVMHGVLIHHTKVLIETAEWIVVFTQHISTIPYKTQQQSLDTNFCMESGQVKSGDNPADTFNKMLGEIFRLTPSIAYGITAEYSTVQKLVQGLKKNGPSALEDCRKSSNKDGAFTDKRVGKSISKRVYSIFMSQDAGSWDV